MFIRLTWILLFDLPKYVECDDTSRSIGNDAAPTMPLWRSNIRVATSERHSSAKKSLGRKQKYIDRLWLKRSMRSCHTPEEQLLSIQYGYTPTPTLKMRIRWSCMYLKARWVQYAWFNGIDPEHLKPTLGATTEGAMECLEGALPRGIPEWECGTTPPDASRQWDFDPVQIPQQVRLQDRRD